MADFAFADLVASHNMDAFLINPTTKTEDEFDLARASRVSGDSIPIVFPNDLSRAKSGKRSAEPTWTIKKISTDPAFLRGYTSDEELASPTENDDSGFGFTSSDTDSTLSLRESPSLEQLAEASTAVQLCNRAQAVQFTAGKPKVVSVSKSVDLTSNGRSPRSPRDFGSNGAYWESSPASSNTPSRSSSGKSPISPTFESFPAPPNKPLAIRRKPILPALQVSGSQRSTRSQTPLAQQRAEFLKHDPFPSTWDVPSSPVSPSAKRRVAKLSSSFSLRNIGKSRRSNDSTDSSASGDLDFLRESNAHAAYTSSPSNTPRRTVSHSLPKMVPRAANERAPPLVLPPCPDDYLDDWNVPYPSRRPSKRDTTPDDSSFETPNALKHIRRKSLSAAYVTARA